MPGIFPPSASRTPGAGLHVCDWYPLFVSHTPRTLFIQLTPQYLTTLTRGDLYVPSPTSSGREAGQIEWSDGTIDTLPLTSTEPSQTCLAESSITAAIEQLGGAVCPKLDDVCPVDATWVNFDRSLKCTTAEDVVTMLKSSERVLANVDCSKVAQLALRKWINIDARMQFRLFIRDKTLVGVSQRDTNAATRFEDQHADSIVSTVDSWFSTNVRPVFDLASDYVMDVYLQQPDRICLIDVCLWKCTDALLFSWDELEDAEWMEVTRRAQFRSVSDARVLPASTIYHGVPLELREGGGSTLVDMAERLVRSQANDNDDA